MIAENPGFDTPLHPEIDHAARRCCRNCQALFTGPAHHRLCRSCWHWHRHRAATRNLVRFFMEVHP